MRLLNTEYKTLSDVDVDVLALALGLDLPLFTDDYRLQNVMQSAGKITASVESKGAKKVWRWELRCTGCRVKTEVPSDAIKGSNRLNLYNLT